MRHVRAICLVLVSVAVPCTGFAQGTPRPASQPGAGPTVTALKQIDWKNFTYPTLPECPPTQPDCECPQDKGCENPGPIVLVKGVHTSKTLKAKFVKVTYVDVTGDKADEALIEIKRELPKHRKGTASTVLYAFLYALKDGRATLAWQGGPEGHLGKVTTKKRQLVTTHMEYPSDRDETCEVRTTYAGTPDGKLKETERKPVCEKLRFGR
jgi:hypothetical protein